MKIINAAPYLKILNKVMINVLLKHEDTKKIIELAIEEVNPFYKDKLRFEYGFESGYNIDKNYSNYINLKVKHIILSILNQCSIRNSNGLIIPFFKAFSEYLPFDEYKDFKRLFGIEKFDTTLLNSHLAYDKSHLYSKYLEMFLREHKIIIPEYFLAKKEDFITFSNKFVIQQDFFKLLQKYPGTKRIIDLSIENNFIYREYLKNYFENQYNLKELIDNCQLTEDYISDVLKDIFFQIYKLLNESTIKYKNDEELPFFIAFQKHLPKEKIKDLFSTNKLRPCPHLSSNTIAIIDDFLKNSIITIPNKYTSYFYHDNFVLIKSKITYEESKKRETFLTKQILLVLFQNTNMQIIENAIDDYFIPKHLKPIIRYYFSLEDGKFHSIIDSIGHFYKNKQNNRELIKTISKMVNKVITNIYNILKTSSVKMNGQTLPFFDGLISTFNEDELKHWNLLFHDEDEEIKKIKLNFNYKNYKEKISAKTLYFLKNYKVILPKNSNTLSKNDFIIFMQISNDLKQPEFAILKEKYDTNVAIILYLTYKNYSVEIISKYLKMDISDIKKIIEHISLDVNLNLKSVK